MNNRYLSFLSKIFFIFNLCFLLLNYLFVYKNTSIVDNYRQCINYSQNINKDQTVFKYINQRTFSLISYEKENSNIEHVSNCWLFYHESEYTYYALSNLNSLLTSDIKYIGYQSAKEILNDDYLVFDEQKTNLIISSNYFSVNEKQVNKCFCEKWNEFFIDMIIIKIDFSNSYKEEQKNKYGQFELRNRLDILNSEYSDESFLVDFDFTQNNNSHYDNYICGFTQSNRISKFNYFNDKMTSPYYVDYESYKQYSYKIYSQNTVWNSGFISSKNYDSLSNGLEGSLHIYAYTNSKNEIVIRATSLFSRWVVGTNAKYQMQTQSFVLNWENKNNFINDFFNNYDQNKDWLQENKFDYKSPFEDHINTVEWMIIIMISTFGIICAFTFLWLLINKKKK